jgi:hypothetical protein
MSNKFIYIALCEWKLEGDEKAQQHPKQFNTLSGVLEQFNVWKDSFVAHISKKKYESIHIRAVEIILHIGTADLLDEYKYEKPKAPKVYINGPKKDLKP